MSQDAYDKVASHADLEFESVPWEDAIAAVEKVEEASAAMHREAILYYVGEGESIGLLADEALKVGRRALAAAARVQAALDGVPSSDVLAGLPTRFEELLRRRADELPQGEDKRTYRASRLLDLIAYNIGGAAALVRRSDSVERAFAVDDLLEVAGMAWLLADLIEGQ